MKLGLVTYQLGQDWDLETILKNCEAAQFQGVKVRPNGLPKEVPKERTLDLEEYAFRKLFTRLNEIQFQGFCLAEIPPSSDPVRVTNYFRGLWLAYQGLL